LRYTRSARDAVPFVVPRGRLVTTVLALHEAGSWRLSTSLTFFLCK